MFIAAFFLFAVPLWAQRGGHAGGGHSFAGHASGFASHGFTGGHMGSGHFSMGRAGFRGAGSFNGARGPIISNGFRNRFGRRGSFRNCFGFRCGAGFFNPWWGSDPWLWSDWSAMDSSFDSDYYNNLEQANQMDQQSLSQQNLEQERMFRQEQQDGDQDSYAPLQAPPRPAPEEKQGTPVVPATVLVFRDEHQQEIQNYAIVGQTLWNFSPGRTQKIPLASLDLPATEKANDDRGVTFRVPAAGDGL